MCLPVTQQVTTEVATSVHRQNYAATALQAVIPLYRPNMTAQVMYRPSLVVTVPVCN